MYVCVCALCECVCGWGGVGVIYIFICSTCWAVFLFFFVFFNGVGRCQLKYRVYDLQSVSVVIAAMWDPLEKEIRELLTWPFSLPVNHPVSAIYSDWRVSMLPVSGFSSSVPQSLIQGTCLSICLVERAVMSLKENHQVTPTITKLP